MPPYGGEHNNCPNDHILPHIHVHLVTDMTWCGSSSSGMNQWLVFLRVIQFTWHLRRRHPAQCLSSCHSRQHCHDASPQHHHQQQQVSASSWTLHLSRQRPPRRVACRRLAVTNCRWGTAARPARRCCDTRSQSGRSAESPARPRRRATWRRRGTQTGDTDCTSWCHNGSWRCGRPSPCRGSTSTHTGTSQHRRRSDKRTAAEGRLATAEYMTWGWVWAQYAWLSAEWSSRDSVLCTDTDIHQRLLPATTHSVMNRICFRYDKYAESMLRESTQKQTTTLLFWDFYVNDDFHK